MLKMSSDPLLEIAKSLLRQRGYDADRALSRWRDVHTAQTFDSVVAQAKKVHEEDRLLPRRHLPPLPPPWVAGEGIDGAMGISERQCMHCGTYE